MTPTEAAITQRDIDDLRWYMDMARKLVTSDQGKEGMRRRIAALDALLAQRDRYEKALRDVHEGAARQLAEPRNHDDDQYALTAIATRVEEALRCE